MNNRKIVLIALIAVLAIVIGYTRITFGGEIWDSAEISEDIIANRNGKMIIERVIGIVLNDAGDGIALNTADPEFNYINYECVRNYRSGDIVITYMYYNPENNYTDDIIYRSDWVIGNIYSVDHGEIEINGELEVIYETGN